VACDYASHHLIAFVRGLWYYLFMTKSSVLEIADGSIAAQVQYHVWAGTPAVVVAAPPGSGKTTVITQILPELVEDADFFVAVASQTRSQGNDIANRLDLVMPGKVAMLASGRDKIKYSAGVYLRKPRELANGVFFVSTVDEAISRGARVVVANTAKWRFYKGSTLMDFTLLVVDEAWQSTIADLWELSSISQQMLLVGDPGQIAPVVSADVSRFAGSNSAPHYPAPEMLLRKQVERTVFLQMPATHRCGPDTTKVLQSLYAFSFTSERKEQHLVLKGTALPEISVSYINAGSPSDARAFNAVADRVKEIASCDFVVDGVTRKLEPSEIAVGVAHVHQALAVRARLPIELAGVAVETAERLQGLQFAATVFLDPMTGINEVMKHNADTGRLCVGLSRATAHTSFITTEDVVDVLASEPENGTALLGIEVRKELARVGFIH
jgi:hypothetical protein